MRPEKAARTLAIFGSIFLIAASLLRLLSVYLVVTDPRLQPDPEPGSNAATAASTAPAMGMYRFSSDGTQVEFQRGVILGETWTGDTYLLDLADGRTTPGTLLEVEPIYEVTDREIRYLTAGGEPDLAVAIQGQRIVSPVFSADGRQLAYIEVAPGAARRLYAIRGLGPAQLILEANVVREVSWSPDGERLTFISNDDRNEEIFLYSFTDHHLLQLTADGRPKNSPVFSRDGQQIAFIAWEEGEQPAQQAGQDSTAVEFNPERGQPEGEQQDGEVYVVGADGSNLRAITDNNRQEFAPAWTADGRVAYSAWLETWPAVAYLYAASPDGQDERRLYPAVAVDSLRCRPGLPGGNRAAVHMVVSNTGSQEIEFPLEVSASRDPLDVLTRRSEFRAQRENLTLQAGETRRVDWIVRIPEDIKVYLAATVETGVEFPLSARFCRVIPRRMFLPRLPLLQTSLFLAVFGTLLSIPWLRHQKSRWLWGLWAAFWVLLVLLVVIESAILSG